MSQSTYITERTNVQSVLWRKKVDNTFFRYKVTAIPNWVLKGWNLEKYFPDKNGFLRKSDKLSEVNIEFNKKIYKANITCTNPQSRANKVYRLWFSDNLLDEIKTTFNMSYMRDLESALRKDMTNIEREIPFWEFVDIEFLQDKRKFIFTAHYKQEPIFPKLFNRLSGSPAIKSVEDDLIESELKLKKFNEQNRQISSPALLLDVQSPCPWLCCYLSILRRQGLY